MTNLLWPGDHRAGDLMTDQTLLQHMVDVESAWLQALVRLKVAPLKSTETDLTGLIDDQDCTGIAIAAEDGGNPVITLVARLRERAPAPAREWIHRGLTSQDVIDSALSLATRAVVRRLRTDLTQQISTLSTLANRHRQTPMPARTLTQYAVPTTFGAKAANWLGGVIDAYHIVVSVPTLVQIGGAAGTLAASTELARLRGLPGEAAQLSVQLAETTAEILGLTAAMPWHTSRSSVTSAGDALAHCTDAWGRIAADVATMSRPEIGEVSEGHVTGRGGSSTMPHKHNPILSVLIRRAAIAAPPLASTLHTAAALANDERPDGAWHAEWDTLRTLARRTLVAGSQCSELLAGLEIHTDRMAVHAADGTLTAEQQQLAAVVGKQPAPSYLGAIDIIIDATLDRAQLVLADGASRPAERSQQA
ncbi:MAG TPA: lyase family protein [Mycobacterium sp.]|nr:lyase family protein [Mycobacterium sp.]